MPAAPPLDPLDLDDHPREACGVFGVWAPGLDVARTAFFALDALQHRGQESAGIAACDGRRALVHKDMGLVTQVFREGDLAALTGHLAIGHTRYSTAGDSSLHNAQPHLIETLHGPLAIAHNGNLINARALRRALMERGVGFTSSADSEAILHLLAASPDHEPHAPDWIARLQTFMDMASGAYSLVVLTADALFAVRDPHGFRPLCLGILRDGPNAPGYVVASESCALSAIGADHLREVQPGEIVRLDAEGLTSVQGRPPAPPALCIFEYVYFARSDSTLGGQSVHRVRQALGAALAREAPADADLVIAVPDSSVAAAIAYASQAALPYAEGLVKNRTIGRTFIQPTDRLRRSGVHLKYSPIPENLRGQRVVLVDDSIVRGHTAKPLVPMLRDAGAREVHLRIASPPLRHPCFMGVNLATHDELLAHRLPLDQLRDHLAADSLAYLSHEGMLRAVTDTLHNDHHGHCSACFSGRYPIPIDG